jgi:hypothetical protein
MFTWIGRGPGIFSPLTNPIRYSDDYQAIYLRRCVLAVVLYVTAALALLLSGPSGMSEALASPRPNKPAGTNIVVVKSENILTIPAAAFTPHQDDYDYINDGCFLKHFHSPYGGTQNGLYYAPVNLPQGGAKVTAVIYYYYDTWASGSGGGVNLQRTQFDSDNYQDMAVIDIVNSGLGYDSDYAGTIDYRTIDNSQYAYWVVLELPVSQGGDDQQIWGYNVTIGYSLPATVTGIQSIPAAAFTPHEDGYGYENHGRYLFTTIGVGGASRLYYAPVQLPQGATVTKITFHWYDADVYWDVIARIQRTRFGQGNYEDLAYLTSTFYGGYGASDSSDIINATIDNSQYAYWVVWDIPLGVVKGCGVVIEYTLPTTAGDSTSYMSISAATFKPHEDGYDYLNDGRFLQYFHDPNGLSEDGYFYAQAQLPQGATVTKVTYYYNDTWTGGGSGGGVHLQRTQFGDGDYVNMAGFDIVNHGQGYDSRNDITIAYALIDNSKNGYWVVLDLPVSQGGDDQQIWGCGVVIEYSYRRYLPSVLKNY